MHFMNICQQLEVNLENLASKAIARSLYTHISHSKLRSRVTAESILRIIFVPNASHEFPECKLGSHLVDNAFYLPG